MKEPINDGGQAFPQPGVVMWDTELHGFRCHNPINGMSLRQYYAGKAMEGLISSGWDCWEDIPDTAVKLADDMLKALEQKP